MTLPFLACQLLNANLYDIQFSSKNKIINFYQLLSTKNFIKLILVNYEV